MCPVLVALALGKPFARCVCFVLLTACCVCVRAMRAVDEVLRTMKEPYRSTGVCVCVFVYARVCMSSVL